MDNFINRLKEGPSFLFLGQKYLCLETSEDLLLSQISRKYADGVEPRTYSILFESQASRSAEQAIAWLQTRSIQTPIPQPLEIISSYSWSGLFTSSFDDIVDRAFRSQWREVQIIVDEAYRPSEPRSRSKLHIWHLFGSIVASYPAGLPPLLREEYWQRQAIAILMANRIPDLITPIGTLAIEGYSSQDDWFSPRELFPVINSLEKGQTHLFSASKDIEKDDRLSFLIKQGKIIIHTESLAECLVQATETGMIKMGERYDDVDFAHQVRIENKKNSIPPHLWHEISSTAHILIESTYLPLPIQSNDKQYADFRQFLFKSAYSPQWEGYARGFAFTREFEGSLRNIIDQRLRSAKSRSIITLLHGQTGTGKTVALGHLAYDIQKQGKYPVVFIERSTGRIKREAIDRYCEWAEEKGAVVTLLIWDGMQQPADYYDMLSYLQSRGRKVCLIGSCYRLIESRGDTALIEAPNTLTKQEIERFFEFINKFDPDLNSYIKKRFPNISGSFLVFLYRLLPPSRTSIRKGIEEELSYAEVHITSQVLSKKVQSNINTLLGKLLAEAGLISSKLIVTEEKREVAGEFVTELQELIGLVMVPGQFNLPCPFELLMRSLGKSMSDDFLDILKSIDIFYWPDSVSGNLQIGPRSSLEAELIVQQRLGGASYEVDYVIKLLSALKCNDFYASQELQFVIDLIQSMGPNGRKPQYYQIHFIRLAECLEKMRIINGITNPRILLQESMLFRESAKLNDDIQIKQYRLNKAAEASRQALIVLEDKPQNKQLRSRIMVDLASTYGQMANLSTNSGERLSLIRSINQECLLAHALDSQNFHSIDVIAWTTRNILQSHDISAEDRLILKETVIHAFNLADEEEYTGEALERLNLRKYELFNSFGQIELSEDSFTKLLEQGSAAGIYIRAFSKVDFILSEVSFTKEQRSMCERTYNYLVGFKDITEKDGKSLFLLLKVWWIWKVGMQMHSGERILLPFNIEDWQLCKNITSTILRFQEFESNLRLKYLLGIAYFHLGDLPKGFQVFRELEMESQFYSRRLIKHYLWSESNGNPKIFNGTVARATERGPGEIYVNEIQKRIPFMFHDAGRSEVNKGDSFSNFRISFSMRGPLADFRE